jgi:hypothetical protein
VPSQVAYIAKQPTYLKDEPWHNEPSMIIPAPIPVPTVINTIKPILPGAEPELA